MLSNLHITREDLLSKMVYHNISPCAMPCYSECCGGPEVISCFECLSLSTTSSFPLSSSIFNFPLLSSETKSLSLSVTGELLKDIHHLKGVLDEYLCCSNTLWSTDVMVCMYRRVVAPCYWSHMGLLHLCAGSILASFTRSPWGRRHIMLGGNTAG